MDDPESHSREFDRKLRVFKQRLDSGQAEEIFGYQPRQTDLSAAQAMQRNANRLSIERLLAHRVHCLNPERFKQFVDVLSEISPGQAEDMMPLSLINLEPISRRIPKPQSVSDDMIDMPDISSLLPLLKPDPRDEQILPR